MRLKTITLNSGVKVTLGRVTALIGPNNVGKSQLLRDILLALKQGPDGRRVVLKDEEIEVAGVEEILANVEIRKHPERRDIVYVRGLSSDLAGGEERSLTKALLEEGDSAKLGKELAQFSVGFLGAASRLEVASSTAPKKPPEAAPQKILQILYERDEKEEIFRSAFRETFGMDVKLDFSALSELVLRVADSFPDIPVDPRAARLKMQPYKKLDEQGDGFRGFAGVILSLLLLEDRILLVDEPEAFLHPVQARKLGQCIGRLSADFETQVILATHSAHFLRGLVEASDDVGVHRLNRGGDLTSVVEMTPHALREITRSPLLSNQRILESLFYLSVVVCESDTDRLVYEYVAGVLEQDQKPHFVYGHNMQTIHKVIRFLKGASVPVATIVDLDILREERDLRNLVDAVGACWKHFNALYTRATAVLQRSVQGHDVWSKLKREGLDAIAKSETTSVSHLLEELAQEGIYLVHVGELESWLPLGCSKRDWPVQALEKMEAEEVPNNLRIFMGKVLGYFKSRDAGTSLDGVE